MHSHLYMSSTDEISMSRALSNEGVCDPSMNPCSRRDEPLARPSIITTPLPPLLSMSEAKPSGRAAPPASDVTVASWAFCERFGPNVAPAASVLWKLPAPEGDSDVHTAFTTLDWSFHDTRSLMWSGVPGGNTFETSSSTGVKSSRSPRPFTVPSCPLEPEPGRSFALSLTSPVSLSSFTQNRKVACPVS